MLKGKNLLPKGIDPFSERDENSMIVISPESVFITLVQSNLNSSTTNGSFTMADSNSFSSLYMGVVGCGEGVVYLASPGRPIDIGLELGYPFGR